MVCPHDFQMKTADGRIVCLKCKETLRKVETKVEEESQKIKATGQCPKSDFNSSEGKG